MKLSMNIKALLLFALCQLSFAPQALAAAAPPNTPATPPDQAYILGPEDVIQIEALNRTDFTVKAKIGPDGTVQVPYLGTVNASNRTVAKLRTEITDALQKGGFFSKPIIQIEILSYASRYVTVLGFVGTPGLVPVDRPYRLSEIMARVGGVRDGGADYVTLRTADGKTKDVTIQDLATGDVDLDPYVQPGDKIYSPKAEVFYIRGQVKGPGMYALTRGMTLQMAISKGGGLTDQGSESDIKITRNNQEISPSDLNMKVEPDDIIDVKSGWF
jgi:polysaccharide biosynthesis/export protein